MVFHQHQCILVHVPKTAGQAFYDVLQPCEGNGRAFDFRRSNRDETPTHMFAEEMRDHDPNQIWNRYFTFAFVRNPWDRAVSEFEWRLGRAPKRKAFPAFEDYVDGLQSGWDYEGDDYRHVVPQKRFVCDENGVVMVDFVGRFEHLERDAQHVFRKLLVPGLTLPHINPSPKRFQHYSCYYTDRTREAIRELYAEDIRFFGYEFMDRSAELQGAP